MTFGPSSSGCYVLAAISVVGLVACQSSPRTGRRPGGRSGGARSVYRSRVVILGVIGLVAFDQLFEVFHEIFFPAGSFDFDPPPTVSFSSSRSSSGRRRRSSSASSSSRPRSSSRGSLGGGLPASVARAPPAATSRRSWSPGVRRARRRRRDDRWRYGAARLVCSLSRRRGTRSLRLPNQSARNECRSAMPSAGSSRRPRSPAYRFRRGRIRRWTATRSVAADTAAASDEEPVRPRGHRRYPGRCRAGRRRPPRNGRPHRNGSAAARWRRRGRPGRRHDAA